MNAVFTADADGLHRKRQKIAKEGLDIACTGASAMRNDIVPCMPGLLLALSFILFSSVVSR